MQTQTLDKYDHNRPQPDILDHQVPTPREILMSVGYDMDGKQVAFVQWSQGTAKMFTRDAERLMNIGGMRYWSACQLSDQHTPSVLAILPNRNRIIDVARFVLGANEGQRIRFKDGNAYNMRRDNLLLV